MDRSSLLVGLALLSSVFLSSVCLSQPASAPDKIVEPEPSVIPMSWELKITIGAPTRFVLTSGKGDKAEKLYYWLVPFKVVNPTSKTQDFLPRVTMRTDSLDTLDAQMAIAPDLFTRIKGVLKAWKYLEEPLAVTQIVGGEDNARDSVAVFPLKANPKSFKLFFCGFSGEQWPMKVPGKNPGQTEEQMMEKVRTIEFSVPGNTDDNQVPPVQLVPGSEKWTMRPMPPRAKYDIDLARVRAGEDPIYLPGSKTSSGSTSKPANAVP